MIRVASYNIRRGLGTDRRKDIARNLAVLREVDADIVAIQEADSRLGDLLTVLPPDAILSETDYVPARLGGHAEDIGWHGNMVLARRSIAIRHARPIALPSKGEQRGAAIVDVRTGEADLRIVAMHLGLAALWRKKQALALLDRMKALEYRLPTVMMGDLNEWNTNGACLLHFAEEHHVAAPGPSFHSRLRVFALDRIITSIDLTVEAAGVHASPLARRASDHLPVWAEISFAGEEAAQKRQEVARSRSS